MDQNKLQDLSHGKEAVFAQGEKALLLSLLQRRDTRGSDWIHERNVSRTSPDHRRRPPQVGVGGNVYVVFQETLTHMQQLV